jgi:hypothetical protein
MFCLPLRHDFWFKKRAEAYVYFGYQAFVCFYDMISSSRRELWHTFTSDIKHLSAYIHMESKFGKAEKGCQLILKRKLAEN